MNVDYRELCVELFGTDDVNQLKEIARSLQEKNPRGAGRKNKVYTGGCAEDQGPD